MRKSMLILPVLVAIIAASGCTTQSGTGDLVLKITDQPSLSIEEALVTISDVQVHMPAEGNESGWVTVVEGPVEYDLVELIDVEQVLGGASLPAGIYTQIRLEVDSAVVTIEDEEHTLTIPSGSVKLVRAFEIREGETTELTLDFDAQESIHKAGPSYIMRPVIRVIGPSPGDGRDGDGQEAECESDDDCGEGYICTNGECEEAEEEEDPVCYSNEIGMLLSDAIEIANSSDCMLNGTLEEDSYQCNNYTGTWWIDLEPFEEAPGCNPACVVDIEAQEAEINWRCTGLIPE